jgi:glutaredoxin
MQEKHSIILYSKPGCHLCEDAKAALATLAPYFVFSLEERDITQDALAFEKYRYTIPVMQIDGKIQLEARIDANKLQRALGEGYGPKIKA